MSVKVQGLQQVLEDLNKEIGKIRNQTKKGLYRAAIPIRRDAQKMCPVVTGNLKASAYINTSWIGTEYGTNSPFKGDNANQMSSEHQSKLQASSARIQGKRYPVVEVGFTAFYAPFVHENPNAGNADYEGTSEVGQWKFLEKAVKQNQDKIVEIIKSEAKK